MSQALESDYQKYRGKCREMSEALAVADPTLTVCKGYYYAPWGQDGHWWCKRPDGTIVDPTVRQFGLGDVIVPERYEEWDGTFSCCNCGAGPMKAEDMVSLGSGDYFACTTECAHHFLGLDDL